MGGKAGVGAGGAVQEEEGSLSYQFAHDLVREVVSADLGAARRAVLHRRIAAVLEAEPGEPAVELLAYHYLHSTDPEQALRYLEQAGDLAQRQYAHERAAYYFRLVVEQLEPQGRYVEAARAREKLGGVLDLVGRFTTELEVLAPATAAYRTAGDCAGEARTLLAAAFAHVRAQASQEALALLGPLQKEPLRSALSLREQVLLHNRLADVLPRPSDALRAAEQALALAQATGADDLLIHAGIGHGLQLSRMARVEEARATFERVLPIAERSGDQAQVARALMNIGWCCWRQGALARSRAALECGVAVGKQVGDTALLAGLHLALGDVAYLTGEWQQAQLHHGRGAEVVGRLGLSFATFDLPISLGQLALAEGRDEEARRHLEAGIALAERSGVLHPIRSAQHLLAEGDLLAGRPEMACRRLEPLLPERQQERLQGQEESTGAAAEAEPTVWEIETYETWALRPVLAWAHLELGAEARAADLLSQALAASRTAGLQLILVDALRVGALLAVRQGRWQEAERALEEVLARCRAMPCPYAEAKALFVYGLLYRAQGEPERAQRQLTAALAILAELGERLYAERVEQTLAECMRIS